ncbi:MAG: hypothetical protein ACP5QK_11405, partial [Myxococcota bacterium]
MTRKLFRSSFIGSLGKWKLFIKGTGGLKVKNEKTLYFCLIVLLLFATSQGCDCGGEVIPKEGDVFTQGDVFTRDVITDISGVDTYRDAVEVIDVSDV